MDADGLLAMAQAQLAGHGQERRQRISFARRLAGSLSARRGVKRKHHQLQEAAAAAQRAWHNREVASKEDFTFHRGEKQKVKGKGKWKQRTAHELLRIAFKPPAQTLASIAATLTPKASVSYVSNVQAMAALQVRRIQAATVDHLLTTPSRFTVFQLVFDETEYRLMLTGECRRRATDSSVLAMAGRLLCNYSDGDDVGEVVEVDVVLPPCNMESVAANNLWAAWMRMLPPRLGMLLNGDEDEDSIGPELIAICPGSDRAAANLMAIAHLENSSPPNVIIFPGFCQQHSTGNAMERAVKRLGIIGPAYCLAKRMRSDKFYSRFLTGLKSALKAKLVWIKASEQPEWRPKMTDVDSAREILELSYFRRDVRGAASGDDAIHGAAGDIEAKVCRRRRLGELCLEEFPGDWTSPDVVFWDRATTDRQECNSREETPIPPIHPLPLPNCACTFAYR